MNVPFVQNRCNSKEQGKKPKKEENKKLENLPTEIKINKKKKELEFSETMCPGEHYHLPIAFILKDALI